MLILDVNKITKNFGYGQLFEDVSFTLNEGESLAIVGPNGCGKSTILKIIAGLENPDKGEVHLKKGTRVAYLDQLSSNREDNRVVYEILKEAFVEINHLEKQIKEYEKRISTESDNQALLEKYCTLIEKFNSMGGYDIDFKMNTVMNGLELDSHLLTQSYATLSGGEKTLVQLAKVLLTKPDLLILDEPTNHLDLKRVEWLETYIQSFKGASVIVSHDRYFLDKMVNQILAFDDGIGHVYAANYSGYLVQREMEFEKRMAQYDDEQEAIKQLEEKAKEFMSLGMGRNSSSLTKQGKTLWERAQRMRKHAIKKPAEYKKINMSFQEENKTSKKIITTDGLTVKTNEGKIILEDISIEICAHERVAILGENGTGKSTFVKTIMGEQSLPITGEVYVGPSVKIGYIPQIIEFQDENQTVLDYFNKAVGLSSQTCRSILSRFKFYAEDVSKRMKNLSGGEKMKIKMAELLQQEVNTLIFDEPTNHIDIPTKEVLEEVLEEFSGTFIFISHDRFFINKFANKIIVFEDGKAKEYLGNYDDYKKILNSVESNQETGRKKYNDIMKRIKQG